MAAGSAIKIVEAVITPRKLIPQVQEPEILRIIRSKNYFLGKNNDPSVERKDIPPLSSKKLIKKVHVEEF